MEEAGPAERSAPAASGRGRLSSLLARGPLRLVRLLATRWMGTGAQFVLNVALGRVLGPEGLGVFYLFQAWYRWLAQLGGLGLPLHVLRSLSVLEGRGEDAAARHFLRSALGLVVAMALGIGLLLVPLAPRLAEPALGSPALAYLLRAAVVAGALWVSLRIVAAAFKARAWPATGLVFEFSALPVGLLALVGVLVALDRPVTADAMIWASVVVLGAAVTVAVLVLVRGGGPAPARAASLGELFPPRSLAPLWGVGLVNAAISNAPLLLMPQFASAAEIALFGVSTRLVALAAAIQDALVSDYSPRFARHHERGDAVALRRTYRRSQLYSIVTYAPILLVFLTLPRLILGLFGPEFREGVEFLTIVALGQAVSSASGLVGNFLSMTHRQSVLLRINTVSLGVMLGLILLLGSQLGAVGVAWAYAATVATRNLIGLAAVRMVIRGMGRA